MYEYEYIHSCAVRLSHTFVHTYQVSVYENEMT